MQKVGKCEPLEASKVPKHENFGIGVFSRMTRMTVLWKLIIRVDFSRVKKSYAYETDSNIFTSPSNADANHTQRIRTRTPIVRKKFHGVGLRKI